MISLACFAALRMDSFILEKDINLAVNNLSRQIQPCDKPLAYSIGDFDPKFGLSQEDFLKAIGQAADIWQRAINKNLFAYSETGALKINLIYDSRQAATDKLKTLGLVIHNDQASYEILKNKYNALNKIYQAQKTELDDIIKYYEEQKANYAAEVKAADKRGGASSDESAILEQERKDLNNLAESTKLKQAEFNKMVDENISRIQAWREYLGFTQQEVAARLNISQAALSQMERKSARLRKNTLEKLAKAMGLTLEQLR